jgi:multidrug efflux pump subunit AcrA (membrane-fusion protein)
MKLFKNIKNKFLSLPKMFKIVIPIILIGLIYFTFTKINSSKNSLPQTKTTTVTKGNLVSTISATGSITTGGNTNIYTSSSGQVTKVYVKNGDTVQQGQKIAEIQLDQDGQKKQTAAWATYLTAKNNLATAKQNKITLQNQLDTAQLSFDTAQDAVNKINDYTKTDLQIQTINTNYNTTKRSLDLAKEKYNLADSAITIAQTQLSSSWYSYQQASSTVYAPASGILSNFALTAGMSVANLSSNTSSSSTTDATQSVGIITNPNNQVTASVSLSEIDVVKVKVGQKATLTMDAFPSNSFTGQVLAINTSGQSSSGVTSYPTIIVFDTSLPNIYPNMSVSANIIIDSKTDVLLIPSTAIETSSDGTSTVQVVKDGNTSNVIVTLGLSNDSQTEILSSLNEGDIIISSSISNQLKSNNNSSSDFSSSNRNNNSRGGGNVMMMGPPGM